MQPLQDTSYNELIFIQDPLYGGGLRSMSEGIRAYYEKKAELSHWAFFSKEQSLSPKNLLHFKLPVLTVEETPRAVTHKLPFFPYIEVLRFLLPLGRFRRIVRGYKHIFACVGFPAAAFILALIGKPFSLYVATTCASEYAGQTGKFSTIKEAWLFKLNRFLLPLQIWQEKYVLKKACNIFALSNQTKNEIIVLGTEPSRIEILHPVIDWNVYAHDPVASYSEREKSILCVCRLDDPRKNLDLLFDAFELLLQDLPEYRLVLVGPGGAMRDNIARRFGPERVILTGPIDDKEKVAEYRKAQLFVLPSKQEGFGIVLLEAMACGTPVISTRSGGPSDIIAEGETGRLVGFEKEELASAMRSILQDKTYWQKLSEKGYTRVKNEFTYERFFKQFDSLRERF